MKPCSKNRKLIAWLALDALEAEKAAALREHLALCEGCRRYWEEMSNVTQSLATTAPDSNLEASEAFHRRVAERLQAVESSSFLGDWWLRRTRLNWRVALPAFAVVVMALLAMVASRYHPALSPPALSTVPTVSVSASESDLASTLVNYQMVANQSLEKLSDLLANQGNKRLPPVPVYTASGLQLAHAPF